MLGKARIAVYLVLSSTAWTLTCAAVYPLDAPAGEWVDVTNNVGGEKWGAYGVHYMKAVPGSEAVIAGVSECGLWLTNDGGATWKKLGGAEIKNRPGRIVFDPKDPSVFWVSGCYGDAPFKTEDGGKTFKRLGKLAHADGVDVDFGDPERKTLLLGLHEQSQSLQLSTDGGQSWKKIGDKLPADSNHSSDPVILDSKTFLVNTAGWKQKATLGIYRTEDAGRERGFASHHLDPPANPHRVRWSDLLAASLWCRASQKHRQGQNLERHLEGHQEQSHRTPRQPTGRSGGQPDYGLVRRRRELDETRSANALEAERHYLQ